MTSTVTIILQVLATLLQILNGFNVANLPAKWQFGFMTLLAALQGLQGIIAHYYTPSGVALTSPTTTVTTAATGTVPAK